MDMWQKNMLDVHDALEEIVEAARLVVDSPSRSHQLVRLLANLEEKLEELDKL